MKTDISLIDILCSGDMGKRGAENIKNDCHKGLVSRDTDYISYLIASIHLKYQHILPAERKENMLSDLGYAIDQLIKAKEYIDNKFKVSYTSEQGQIVGQD